MAEMPPLEVQIQLDVKGTLQQMIGTIDTGSRITHATLHEQFRGELDEETEDTMIINDAFARMMDSVATFRVYAEKL